MTIAVIDFYRNIGKKQNIFATSLKDPVFYILSKVNGRMKELTLKLTGDIRFPDFSRLKDFEVEAYRNYYIIVNFLLGEKKDVIRESWGLTKGDYKELIFELYCALLKNHATCGVVKRGFLYVIGIWKFYFGGKLC